MSLFNYQRRRYQGNLVTQKVKPTKGAFGKAHPLVKMKRVNLGHNWRLG